MDKTLINTVALSVGLMLLTLLFYPHFKDELRGNFAEWHVINTNIGGQHGDANLIVVGDQVVMIDAGRNYNKPSTVVHYLQKFEIDRIHHLFVSHPHAGFYGGIVPILRAGIKIDNIYAQAAPVEAMVSHQARGYFTRILEYAISQGAMVVEIDKGFTVSLPNQASLEVIYAWEGGEPVENHKLDETSLAIRFQVGQSKVLFAGDIDGSSARQLAQSDDVQAEILKVPHPGEDDESLLELLEAANPGSVIVPGPKRRWCVEPGRVVREWTDQRQIPAWVTGLNGNIRVVWRPSQLLIVPQYADRVCGG